MKIGIMTPTFVNIKMNVDGEFDPLGNNKGYTEMSYSSDGIEIAKKLAEAGHEVICITSADTQAGPYVKSILRKHNIDARFVSFETHGLGYNIEFNTTDGTKRLISYPKLVSSRRTLDLLSTDIFENLDIFMTTELDLDLLDVGLINRCREYGTKLMWLTDDIDRLEEDDFKVLAEQNICYVTIDTYLEKLGIHNKEEVAE